MVHCFIKQKRIVLRVKEKSLKKKTTKAFLPSLVFTIDADKSLKHLLIDVSPLGTPLSVHISLCAQNNDRISAPQGNLEHSGTRAM